MDFDPDAPVRRKPPPPPPSEQWGEGSRSKGADLLGMDTDDEVDLDVDASETRLCFDASPPIPISDEDLKLRIHGAAPKPADAASWSSTFAARLASCTRLSDKVVWLSWCSTRPWILGVAALLVVVGLVSGLHEIALPQIPSLPSFQDFGRGVASKEMSAAPADEVEIGGATTVESLRAEMRQQHKELMAEVAALRSLLKGRTQTSSGDAPPAQGKIAEVEKEVVTDVSRRRRRSVVDDESAATPESAPVIPEGNAGNRFSVSASHESPNEPAPEKFSSWAAAAQEEQSGDWTNSGRARPQTADAPSSRASKSSGEAEVERERPAGTAFSRRYR